MNLARPLSLAALLSAAPGFADSQPDTKTMRILNSGDAVHEFIQQDLAGGAIRVTFLFHGRPEVLWNVLRTFDRTFEFVPGMRYNEEIEKSETRALVRQRVKKFALLPQIDYLVEFRYTPYERIEYHQVEGDLSLLEGSWQFDWREELGATVVTHEMRVLSKFPVPRWLIRRSLAQDTPDMMLCLRARAGGSGSAPQERADLDKCEDTREPPTDAGRP